MQEIALIGFAGLTVLGFAYVVRAYRRRPHVAGPTVAELASEDECKRKFLVSGIESSDNPLRFLGLAFNDPLPGKEAFKLVEFLWDWNPEGLSWLITARYAEPKPVTPPT